jgi:putative phosphoribosyl transferase
MSARLFTDREDAGRQLAGRLRHLRDADVVVLGLPRGGVPVAFEIAAELGAPLDVIVVRKLGVPFQPEYGFGAVGEEGTEVVDGRVVRLTRLTEKEVSRVSAREQAEVQRLVRGLRRDRPPVPLAGRTAIIVDDGVATGSTMRAACLVARARGAARIVLAIPVAPPEAIASLQDDADEIVCLFSPEQFFAIGEWYDDFTQTTDDEVASLLDRSAAS